VAAIASDPIPIWRKSRVVAGSDRLYKIIQSNKLQNSCLAFNSAYRGHGINPRFSVLPSTIPGATPISRAKAAMAWAFRGRAARRCESAGGSWATPIRQHQVFKHDQQLASMVRAIRTVMGGGKIPRKRRLGFGTDDQGTAARGQLFGPPSVWPNFAATDGKLTSD
jgi:hypothetical protein